MLWLDDLEPFLNTGVTLQTLLEWHAGVCLDLRGRRAVTVDPAAQTARVEGGATWGEVDAATQEHGLAVTGRVSATGVAGFAGSVEDGEEAMRPLRELSYLGVNMVGPMPDVAVQQLVDPPNPKGMQNYWTADFFNDLPRRCDRCARRARDQTGFAAHPDHPCARRRRDRASSTRTRRRSVSAPPGGTSTFWRRGPTPPTPTRTSPTPAASPRR